MAIVLTAMAVAGHAERNPSAPALIETIRIRPSATDPAIKTFDTPHFIYVSPALVINSPAQSDQSGQSAIARRELLLWIPGTVAGTENQGPGAAANFCQLAASLGYHVIILKYPNDVSATVCRNDPDPAAFERFRLALIEGGPSPHLTLPRTESIEHRLLKLLGYLQRTRPHENWGQFLDGESINWSAIAVAGQSQGGGHAALIGIKHRVARVICFGAPKDYSLALAAPAAWLHAESATPKDRFFAFNHDQDRQGCSPAQQRENLRALGLEKFGPAVDVDQAAPPYGHTRILTTNFPGKKITSQEAHTTGINPRNEALFGKVWRYMLTEKTP